jgi:hypothetical protein
VVLLQVLALQESDLGLEFVGPRISSVDFVTKRGDFLMSKRGKEKVCELETGVFFVFLRNGSQTCKTNVGEGFSHSLVR